MTSVFDISETFRNFIALIDVANQNLLEDEFVKKMKIVTKKSTAENEKIVEEISIEIDSVTVEIPFYIEDECETLFQSANDEFSFNAKFSELTRDEMRLIGDMMNDRWLENFALDSFLNMIIQSSEIPIDTVILSLLDSNLLGRQQHGLRTVGTKTRRSQTEQIFNNYNET